MDSLIRGWPFGTLLTWKVTSDDPARALARPFWSVVDRTEEVNRETTGARHPPGAFHMILDGQQRVQSLLLAFAGDGWGFKLPDRRWHEHLTGAKPRGPRGRPHWSLGCLCVDLPALAASYSRVRRATLIDYTAVLRWVVTDDVKGQSKLVKPSTYSEPLDISSEHPGRFLRLSRLWKKAPEQAGVDSYHAEELAETLLADDGVSDSVRDAFRRPLGALLMALKDVKQTDVVYLELGQYEDALGSRESYNDAIIQIFTRLNTAGRSLKREDITFAWLKGGWNSTHTENRDAIACFEELAQELKDLDAALSVDDLVSAVSFLWSTVFSNGKLLTNDDLIKGDAIRPMALDVSTHWALVRESALAVCQLAKERRFRFREQYQSVYALAYLWTWHFSALKWRSERAFKEVGKDSLEKSLTSALSALMDRWLICTQWAGVWTSGGTPALAGYAARLSVGVSALALCVEPDSAVAGLHSVVVAELKEIEQSAINGLAAINADDRQEVRGYFTALWLWNRLDPIRWERARVTLRQTSRRQSRLEVDHIVAWNLWQKKLKSYEPVPASEGAPPVTAEELSPAVNELGNCMLLENNFNIVKSDKPLKSFLEEVHEFRKAELSLTDWSNALDLDLQQVDSGGTSPNTLRDLFVLRTQKIRSDLEHFIRGTSVRIDVSERQIGSANQI